MKLDQISAQDDLPPRKTIPAPTNADSVWGRFQSHYERCKKEKNLLLLPYLSVVQSAVKILNYPNNP